MSSQSSFGSSMLFQTINDDLNASLATADELSKEFNSLLKESSTDNNNTKSQTSSAIFSEKPQSISSVTTRDTRGNTNGSSNTFSPSSTVHPVDSVFFSNKNTPSPPPVFTTSPLSSPKIKRESHSPLPRAGSDIYSFSQSSPKHSPHSPRRNSPSRYDRSPRGSISYADKSPSPSPTAASSDQQPWSASLHPSSNMLSLYDSGQMGRKSPRLDRARSPLTLNPPMSNTLPRNFAAFRNPDEGVQQQKSSSKWNETDLDVSYEKKPHRTYDSWLIPATFSEGSAIHFI